MEAMIGPPPAATASPAPVLADGFLLPGIVLLDGTDAVRSADPRALALLGCRDNAELAGCWPQLVQRLEAAGLPPLPLAFPPAGESAAAGAPGSPLPSAGRNPAATTPTGASAMAPAGAFEVEWAPPAGGADRADGADGGRRLRVFFLAASEGGSGAVEEAGAAGVLLIQDAELGAALESDLRAASQMRSLAEITPAVAHDLRAPINAMVLNLEVLKQTLAGSHALAMAPAGAPGRDPRERQQRYVHVLSEELSRLHKTLEIFLAQISPRGERGETLDLRDAVQDLAALLRPPARKLQAQVEVLAPDRPVAVAAQRYLLRQALLHVGLAALGPLPREGTLEIRLDQVPGRARLRILATALLSPPGDGSPAALTGVAAIPALGSGPTISSRGIETRLEVAQSLLALFGATLCDSCRVPGLAAEAAGPRAADDASDPNDPNDAADRAERGAAPRIIRAFEIDFPLSQSN